MNHPGETYDIIFVGGGATGCVAAGKLAAANPGLKVLILEAGLHSLNVDTHVQPARYIANLLNANKLRKTFTLHIAQPSEAVAIDRSPSLPHECLVEAPALIVRLLSTYLEAHRVLIAETVMVYTRASASDYDNWEEVHENPGWGSKDLIPLLKQIETYTLPTSNSTHGMEGPIRISYPDEDLNVARQFLEVVAKYDKDTPVMEDWNDFKTGDGYGTWPKYIDDKTGRRSDAAHNFIYNQADNRNLTVLTECRGVRVVFEGTRAVGVEYIAGNTDSSSYAYASKLVVLSAGAFGSPAILERSGIGSPDVLHKNGIAQLVDLPGVGERYNDHNLVYTHYFASPEADSIDPVAHGPEEALSGHIAQWKETGKGWMARNGADAAFKMRPTTEELKTMGPAFELRWKEFFEAFPDKPVIVGAPVAGFIGPKLPDPSKTYLALGYYVAYPASVGNVHIAHGLDSYGPLKFIHGYLDEEADVVALRWMYKHLREVARRMPFYRGEVLDCHPAFPAGSGATCKPENDPVDINAPKLVFTVEDDAAIDEYHRRTVGTTWHSLGTCAMKPRDKGGVVDSRLYVYGTTQLKVADLSTCPENVGANTYNTALAVGAKAAVLIAEDLGLNLGNSKCSL